MAHTDEIERILSLYLASVSAVTDVIDYRILNVVTFPCIAFGIFLSLVSHEGCAGWKILWMFILFLSGIFGVMGMGDLKLAMALTALRGIRVTAASFFFGALFLMGYCMMTEKTAMMLSLKDTVRFMFYGATLPKRSDSEFPFALFVAIGYGAVMVGAGGAA